MDAGNVASAKTMVPIGLYDLEKLRPPLQLTLSRGGEEFKPIGGGVERLPGGLPVLLDSRGLVVHLYPHRDSRESMITDSTRAILVIGAGVPGVPRELVVSAVEEVVRLVASMGWSSCREVVVKP